MAPDLSRSIAWRTWSALRLWVPTWTTRLVRRAASIMSRPSRMLWEAGFSTYTCLPASQARMVAGACQWSGVAMTTASTDLLSNTRRMSRSVFGVCPAEDAALAAERVRFSSASQTWVMATSLREAKVFRRPMPRPPGPIRATPMRSLLPAAREAEAAVSRVAEAACCRKARRVRVGMGAPFAKGSEAKWDGLRGRRS